MTDLEIKGRIIDLESREIFKGRVGVNEDKISFINRDETIEETQYILPGFIDSHVHIESSMLVPSEFARMAVLHGTVATISDPHEIANVCGLDGIRYMIEDSSRVPFYFFFGASPCVPATQFETAGALLGPEEVRELLETDDLLYLSEVMNYPGVLSKDSDLIQKMAAAKRLNKPVDGHAPGLRAPQTQAYAAAGISTDHECFTIEEARDKLAAGMHILIREGSAAKNFSALHPLFHEHAKKLMFCTDDAHPDELLQGHINRLVARAVTAHGYDLFTVLHAACLHPIEHYKLPVGRLRRGDSADFIVTNDIQQFTVKQTYIQGQLVADQGRCSIPRQITKPIHVMHAAYTQPTDFVVPSEGDGQIRIIEAIDGELVTKEIHAPPKIQNERLVCDLERDLLKLTVVNRYQPAPPAVAFIHRFGLKRGAIASSVAHDSHNILAVGTSDAALSQVVNEVIRLRGGIVVWDEQQLYSLPLPVAGLMSLDEGPIVAERYVELTKKARTLGCPLHAPFMTLAFMALLVIPSLKLSDKGLFDVDEFSFTSLYLKTADTYK